MKSSDYQSTNRSTIRMLIVAMALVAIAIGITAIGLLYRSSYGTAMADAENSASTLANMVEAVARFDKRFSINTHEQGTWDTTLSQVEEAMKLHVEQGSNAEITIGRRIGDELQVMRYEKDAGLTEVTRVPFDGRLAQPLFLALHGQRGNGELLDYAGQSVLAGYAPVATLDIGLVYKLDTATVREPFIQTSLWLAAVALLLITLGGFAFTRLARPLLRRAEHSEQRLSALMRVAPVGVFEADQNNICTFVNQRWCELTGISPEQALGNAWYQHLRLNESAVVLKAWQDFVAGAQPFSLEFRVSLLDGSTACLYGQAAKLLDENGDAIGFAGTLTDISAQQASRESSRLSEAQAMAQVGNWELDLLTGSLLWSNEIFHIFEIDPTRFGASYEAFLNAIHPEDRDLVNQAYTDSVANRQPYRITHRLQMPDQRIKWVEESCETFYDIEGKPIRSVGTVQDITLRVESEQETQRTRQLLRHVIDASPDWIFVKDLQHRFLIVNQAFSNAMALQPQQLIGHSDSDFWPHAALESDRDANHSGFYVDDRRAFEGESLRNPNELIRVADGSVRVFDTVKGPLRDQSGAIVGLFAYCRDVTEQRHTQDEIARHRDHLEELVAQRSKALFDSEAQLRQAQQIAQLGHWTANLQTGALQWSDEIYRIFGRDPAAFSPSYENFFACIHPDDVAAVKASERAAELSGRHSIDHRIVRPDGTMRWVHEEAQLKHDEQGHPTRMTGTVQDITERKQIETELTQARDEAERASQAKSDFLSRMSHELRTPMNAILGFAQVLEAEPSLDPELVSFVEEIHRAGDHLLEMINDLLDLSRIESGKLSIAVETTRLQPVLDQSIKLLQAMLSTRQVSLHGASCDPTIQLLADKTRLRQVLLNVLSNAIKYNSQGGRIDIEFRPVQGERLQIRISDTGAGIPAEKIKRLFRPFERLGAELTSTDGAGIGLALSKQLTEMMGGTLGVESTPGQGSTFWVELPMAQGVAVVEAVAAPATQEDAAEKLRVLYVEDNAANLRVVVAMLRHQANLQLLSATNGEHGLEMARRMKPDLILLDIHLPGMDGYEVLAALRSDENTRDIPVVALSADAMPLDIETGLKAGFRRYLTKPVKFDELLDALTEVKQTGLSA